MEKEEKNYYVVNLETEKLNIFTAKEYYEQLPGEKKKIFRRFCHWSSTQGCWVSKGKAQHCFYLKDALEKLGFIDKGSVGERISFDEKVSREQQRAERRVESSQRRAEKAENKSDQLYQEAKEMASIIPFGQPIHEGHYSESSDRNYRKRIGDKFRKSFAEKDKAAYYEEKAETASFTAKGKKYQNPAFLERRIKACHSDLRVLNRRLGGKIYRHSNFEEVSEEDRLFYTRRIDEENEKLKFYVEKMKEINPSWEESSLQKKKGRGSHL